MEETLITHMTILLVVISFIFLVGVTVIVVLGAMFMSRMQTTALKGFQQIFNGIDSLLNQVVVEHQKARASYEELQVQIELLTAMLVHHDAHVRGHNDDTDSSTMEMVQVSKQAAKKLQKQLGLGDLEEESS